LTVQLHEFHAELWLPLPPEELFPCFADPPNPNASPIASPAGASRRSCRENPDDSNPETSPVWTRGTRPILDVRKSGVEAARHASVRGQLLDSPAGRESANFAQ
jgi:hypothetical protein